MRNFTDSKGRVWGIRIDRKMLRSIQASTGILLTDLWTDEMALLTRVCEDPILAGDLVWCCVTDQATERTLTKEEFEADTDGDCYEAMVKALIESTCDFFPKRRRSLMSQLLEAANELETATVAAAGEEIAQSLQNAISSLDSSESIPTGGHIASS